MVELFVVSDLIPKGIRSDRDIEDDQENAGIVFPGTEIWSDGGGVYCQGHCVNRANQQSQHTLPIDDGVAVNGVTRKL